MNQFVQMSENSIQDWKDFTRSAVKFLDMYRNLLDTYVLDFFTEDLWSLLNPQWTVILDTLTPCDLANFLSRDSTLRQKNVWPLSLQALRATAFTYTLPRRSVLSADPFTSYLNHQIQNRETFSDCDEHGYDTNNSLEQNTNLKTDAGISPLPFSMQNLLSVLHKESKESNITTKYSEVSSINHSTDSSSVSDIMEDCSNSTNSGSQQCSEHEKLSDVQNSKKSKSTVEHEEKNTSIHICQQLKVCKTDDSAKDSTKLMPPSELMSVRWGDASLELSAAAGQHMLLKHVFRRHLKPKKQHEVARLALIAGQIARNTCNGVMIDVGSGQGHLSRLLAYGHDVRVVCLEAQDDFINGAKKFDNQLEMAVEKMKRRETSLPSLPPAPRHTTCLLEPHMDPQTFREVVTGAWPELDSGGVVCGLLGLHTCGNLAPTMLRIFTNMSTCQAVVSVGCCYMKLDTHSDETEHPGYPMSKFVCSLPGFMLSYEAREVACHAIEMYISRLKVGADNLKVHCYRAALEEIIMKYWPHHRHAGLRSVNHAHKMEFSQYAVEAVSRLRGIEIPRGDLTSAKTKHNLARWMQVVIFYSLRLLLAPVVESVVLLDRLLFLYEKGVESILVPTFDPQLSPRNHVLVAVKPSNKF
ncbi:methyltransferase-like protein 25B isoform X1 [Procambarus clarkii]|uniref:methyltransferase-like protein 25B isoform X1 n=1 Tax=Procambarus clarkii TaxID=6728 RepID=UPI003743BE76